MFMNSYEQVTVMNKFQTFMKSYKQVKNEEYVHKQFKKRKKLIYDPWVSGFRTIRPIRVDHTIFFQVAIKTHSFKSSPAAARTGTTL